MNRDVFTCIVCYVRFDLQQREPMVLPCGHTLCRTCLFNSAVRACPLDRSDLPLDKSTLKRNHLVAQQVVAINTPVHQLLQGLELGSLAVSPDELVLSNHRLGAGGMGEVWRATLRGKQVRAVLFHVIGVVTTGQRQWHMPVPWRGCCALLALKCLLLLGSVSMHGS